MGRYGYAPEFRQKVLDLVESGRAIAEVAADLGVCGQTIYSWRRQARIDNGEISGLNSAEKAELSAARRRIKELETELAIRRRATELLGKVTLPKRRFLSGNVKTAEGLPVQMATRVLGCSESGYYAWLT